MVEEVGDNSKEEKVRGKEEKAEASIKKKNMYNTYYHIIIILYYIILIIITMTNAEYILSIIVYWNINVHVYHTQTMDQPVYLWMAAW